ncbi:MAG TPA: hypothetical protein PKE69_08220 [Pyrinomonadaceae bacterium]|nr:hypothetical protein [Pyrinomonadaceae bacterium]
METNSPEKLLEALIVLDTNLPTYKDTLGLTNADLQEVSQNRANLAQALTNGSIIEADKQTSTAIKNALFDGDSNVKVGIYPAFAISQLPFPDALGGILKQYNELKARIKAAKGYTKEIGTALGVETVPSGGISPADLVGAAKLTDLGEYQFNAEFKKQGQSGMVFQWRLKGTEKWSASIVALQSPFVIQLEAPAEQGAVLQIEVRCRYLKGNDQVGRWSPLYVLNVTA